MNLTLKSVIETAENIKTEAKKAMTLAGINKDYELRCQIKFDRMAKVNGLQLLVLSNNRTYDILEKIWADILRYRG